MGGARLRAARLPAGGALAQGALRGSLNCSTSNLLSAEPPSSSVWRSVFLLIQALIQTIFLLKSTVCTILFTVMHRNEENINRKGRVSGRILFWCN